MLKYSKTILLLLFSLLLQQTVMAQMDCAEKMVKAQNAFDQGNIEEVEGLLRDCLKGGFNDSQKEKAYKLLALCNIYQLRKSEAEADIKKLLKTNPFSVVDEENDPQEYIELLNNFNRQPSFYYGVEAGGNLGLVQVDRSYVITQDVQSSNYNEQVGFEGNLNFGMYLYHWLDWGLFAGYRMSTIELRNKDVLGILTTTYQEQQQFFTSGVMLNINFRRHPKNIYLSSENEKSITTSPLYPFIRLTGNYNQLLSADASIKGTFALEGSTETSQDQKSVLTKRYTQEIRLGGGIGLKKQYKRGAFYFLVQYQYALNDLVLESERYKGDIFSTAYAHIDDDYRNHLVTFEVGYQHYFYRFKKKK
ncbi:hypothetical protein [Flammeovirga aprica]|uniref:Outer membrane protein beta-barrel domain-containing protein n=1 Tax=Flammeovirga aprica JL-4 TaxID=694437 RepID=A0A7X9RX15_9BACT|nr:hypothetical protein [Flammeovirga aprica]NME70275.1 hypothetical protein [Flammeovirga aprica JL-4]